MLSGYIHTFCHNVVYTNKLLVLVFSLKHNMLKYWSMADRFSFLLFSIKLLIGGFRKIAVS
jgi:hypothetical protein